MKEKCPQCGMELRKDEHSGKLHCISCFHVETIGNWETCSLHLLLVRIMNLNRVLLFCRGRAADAYRPTQQERDRLIEIYSRRVKQQNSERK